MRTSVYHEGFPPIFDLDSTEHSIRTEASVSQELIDYMVQNTGHKVSDPESRPVIRTTAAAAGLESTPMGVAPCGPQSHFPRRLIHPDHSRITKEGSGVEEQTARCVIVSVPWEMCANLCRIVDQFFQNECHVAGIPNLGASCQVSPRSTAFGANLIFNFKFTTSLPPLVIDQLVHSVTERIRTIPGAVIQSADFPGRQAFNSFCLQQKTGYCPDIQVYNDEILLKSSL